jgi:hypothetical protein
VDEDIKNFDSSENVGSEVEDTISALPDDELIAAAARAREHYSQYIIRILRVNELRLYYPLFPEKDRALAAFRDAMGDKTIANRVIEYFAKAEQSCYILEGAEDSEELASAMEVLRGKLNPPLMVELPEETVRIIWQRAGSWTGAMKLAGLDPLTTKMRREAQVRYAAANASIEHLPGRIRRGLSDEMLDTLARVCAIARKLKRPLTSRDLSENFLKEVRRQLHAQGCTLNTVLKRLGVELQSKK